MAPAAALAPVSEAFTKAVRAVAASRQIPWVDFARGQRKDDVAHEFLAGFAGTEGVLFIGGAQEKVPLFGKLTGKPKGPRSVRGSQRGEGWAWVNASELLQMPR